MTHQLPPAHSPRIRWMAPVERRILGRNNLLKIAFLQEGIRAACAVARVVVPGQWYGSGFLVAPNLLLTNNHVLPTIEIAAAAQVEFNYQEDIGGNPCPVETFSPATGDLFKTNPDLDYTLIRLAGQPGEKFGYLPLRGYDLSLASGDAVNIIQHPKGRFKEVALQENSVTYVDDKLIQYLTDTDSGSSGSPVFNNLWQVVGLHHASVPDVNVPGDFSANEAVAIAAILADAGVLIP